MKKVLITGAAGDVGTYLRRELAEKYRLVLSDRRALKPAEPSVSGPAVVGFRA